MEKTDPFQATTSPGPDDSSRTPRRSTMESQALGPTSLPRGIVHLMIFIKNGFMLVL